ncbi:MAG: HD domain-containing phosphohydrolase [Capsulimonas sp.]|uniref:HD domain-containing phosphohydrolase n=1 Tax=Capsulimonas sp. TaxID=2494211 RepID=UPI0032676C5C
MLNSTKDWTTAQKIVIKSAIAYVAVFLFMLIFHPCSKEVYTAFSDLFQPIGPFFASACCLTYVWRGYHPVPVRRIGWLLIGIASASYGVGGLLWSYLELVRKIETPFPSCADYAYFLCYPFLIVGVVLLFGSIHITGRLRQMIDGAIAASSFGIISWHFLIQQSLKKEYMTPWAKALSAAYPLSDIAVLFCAIILFGTAYSNPGLRRSIAFLTLGVSMVAFTDSIWGYMNLTDRYETGSWIDPGWSYGFTLIGLGAMFAHWWPVQAANLQAEKTSRIPAISSPVRVLIPYLAAVLAFVIVALHDFKSEGAIGVSTLITGFALILLVIVRQMFTLLENTYLTNQLRSFNDDLERIVSKRTRQMTALHQLTKAVNTSLKTDEVMQVAEEHTLRALNAEAVLFWLIGEDKSPEGTPLMELRRSTGLQDLPKLLDVLRSLPLRRQVEAITVTDDHGRRSGICLRAPLCWRERCLGMIGVVRWTDGVSPTDTALLESIGLEVGSALENARMYGAALEAADRDPMTSLLNHRAIHQRLHLEVEKAEADGIPLSIIMMDLNNFKLFNDTYGHPVGDQILKNVAASLSTACAERGFLGRYGGDEFLLVAPNTTVQQAIALTDMLRERMLQEGFRRVGEERTVPVSLSYGVAGFPEDSKTRHELVAIADTNLYAAKHTDSGIMATSDNQRSLRALSRESSFEVLDAMVTAVDNKDRYTRRHSEDVTEYALWIAEELTLSEETMRVIRIGGLLHDVGKIGIPDEILRKPGRLTPEEYEVLKRHPRIGALMVGAVPGMESILDAVNSHHERWDGQGYPDAMAGEEIPLLGRIMAVADAFSAMTTDRPYRKGLDWEVALEEIRGNIGTQFDPAMADAFLKAAVKRAPQRYRQQYSLGEVQASASTQNA